MWKWIVGAILLLFVLLGGTCYYRLKKFTTGGDAASAMIAASPAEVFAAFTDPDSMRLWLGSETTVLAAHRGMVAEGDTLRVQAGTRASQQFAWIVDEVRPGALLVRHMIPDSTGTVFAVRRDSLVAVGDSTLIVSTIGSPVMDSLKTTRGDSGSKVGGAILSFGSKMIVGSFRELSRMELRKLKMYLEGDRP